MSTKSNKIAQDNEITDPLFADLVERCSSLVEAGQIDRALQLINEHSGEGDRLRRLLPAIEALTSLDDLIGELPAGDEKATRQLGDFCIERELGRGGMGVVYEVEQISLGRRLALKVLPLAATLSPQQLQRFKNEARAAAALDHPHIVGIHSVGVERGVHYYAMALIEGCSLAQLVAALRVDLEETNRESSNAVPAAETVPVAALSTALISNPQDYYLRVALLVADAADAIEYAHGQGVIHRDLKPANLLIDQQSHIWVTDFGLARLENDAGVTLTGDILGTLRYMSPEQAAGNPSLVDYRADIYALGATLCELLTLRPAFDSDDRAELLQRVVAEQAEPLRRRDPRIPTDLETIVGKSMEKEPADRYESAGRLAADLRAFVEHRPIVARAPSLVARTQKWMRRHTTAVAAALLVLLIVVVGLGASAWLLSAANDRTVAEKAVAEENLSIAVDAIDRLLAQVAADADVHGQLLNAEQLYAGAAEAYDRVLVNTNDPGLVLKAARTRARLAEVLGEAGHMGRANEEADRGLQVLRLLSGRTDVGPEEMELRAYLLSVRGNSRLKQRDYGAAEKPLSEALQLREKLVEEKAVDPARCKNLVLALNNMAVLRMETGDLTATFAPPAIQQELAWLLAACPDRQLRDGRQAVTIAERLCASDPENTLHQIALAAGHLETEDFQSAHASAERALKISGVGSAYEFTLLALAQARLGQWDDARQWYGRAQESYKKLDPSSQHRLEALMDDANATFDTEAPTTANPE